MRFNWSATALALAIDRRGNPQPLWSLAARRPTPYVLGACRVLRLEQKTLALVQRTREVHAREAQRCSFSFPLDLALSGEFALLAAKELVLGVSNQDIERATASYRSLFNTDRGFMPTSREQRDILGQDTLYGWNSGYWWLRREIRKRLG